MQQSRRVIPIGITKNRHLFGLDQSNDERLLEPCYRTVELVDALTTEYPQDYHAVPYVVRGMGRMYRLNKPGLARVSQPIDLHAFFCDVDNPKHVAWTEELLAKALEEYEALDVLKTVGIYHTKGGRRFVQPLATPVQVPEAELHLWRWLRQLQAAGLNVDLRCRDWTRHYRLPHVLRDGKPYRSPFVRLDRMQPIEVPPLSAADVDDASSETSPQCSPRSVRPTMAPVSWTKELPAIWNDRVPRLAAAIKAVDTEWHTLFLTLAGAMLTRGVAPEDVPGLCRAISIATQADTRTPDRESTAYSSVQKYLAGQRMRAMPALKKEWPGVAAALEDVLARGNEAILRDTLKVEQTKSTDDEGMDRAYAVMLITSLLRTAPPRVTLVASDSLDDKRQAVVALAHEGSFKREIVARDNEDEDGAPSESRRGPRCARIAISVSTHREALELTDELRKAGVATRRLFGPLSLRDEHNQPVCKLHQIAVPLVAGGQVMQWELCRGRDEPQHRCPHFKGCAARLGEDGPEDALVVVSIHTITPRLADAIGNNDILVIEDLPDLLQGQTLSASDLDAALELGDSFVGGYGTAFRPLLLAVRDWFMQSGEVGISTSIEKAARAASSVVSTDDLAYARRGAALEEGDLIDCALAAPLNEQHAWAPPIMHREICKAKQSVALATKLGTASKVYKLIYAALKAEADSVVEVKVEFGVRRLRITSLRDGVVRALRREGPTVVLGGQTDNQLRVLTKAIGYEPSVRHFRLVDAAPVTRTMVRTPTAIRRRWVPGGKVKLVPSLTNALRTSVDWALEGDASGHLVVVTFKTVALALAAASRPTDRSVEEAWKAAKQRPETLGSVRTAWAPILARWPGALTIKHFEEDERLTSVNDIDALVTLGDPWRGREPAEDVAAYLGFKDAFDEQRTVDCRAALERAHALLRAGERERPGRALHIGSVLPGATGWHFGNVSVRGLPVGRPRRASAMATIELEQIIEQLGGVKPTARLVRLHPTTLRDYCKGRANVPAAVAKKLRHLSGAPP